MTPYPALLIRPSNPTDVAAMAAIYRAHVLRGSGTFELEPPGVDEFAQRRTDVVSNGWPWLVAQLEGEVKGFAYAGPFRPRPAYRFCLEDSIYISEDRVGRGLGRLLMVELLAICESRGARQMLAVIGDSGNQASIALHGALGFVPTGTIHAAGWKFDRWLDVVLMQKALGPGSSRRAGEGGP
jgi:L-amino acid N-acyltransferase YncA